MSGAEASKLPSRYPQMRNQVMRKPERDNWLAIRDKIYVATCGL